MAPTIVALTLALSASSSTGVPPLGEIAAQFRRGDRDDAVAAVMVWTQGELEAGVEGLLEAEEALARAAHDREEERARGRARLLAAAALLSDAARRSRDQGARPRARWELQGAVRLVRATRSEGGPGDFGRRFTLFAGLMLHDMGDLAGAYEVLSEDRRSTDGDPELLLARGAVSETVAALRDYDLPEARPPLPGARDEPRFVIEGQEDEARPLPRTTLADAQALYARALRLDPGLLEASLRLGRVLLLRGRPREALPELLRVGRESSSPSQRYMARLFEGRARERLGDPAGAAAAFAAAAEVVPNAQAALVGLGRALAVEGRAAEAQDAFDRALQGRTPPDPWLDYLRGQPDRIDDLVEELRRLVP